MAQPLLRCQQFCNEMPSVQLEVSATIQPSILSLDDTQVEPLH